MNDTDTVHTTHSTDIDIDIDMSVQQLISTGLNQVRHRLSEVTQKYQLRRSPTLIAVSKLKPVSMIQYAYTLNQYDYGENYVQELCSKINDPALQSCDQIRWHYIGHLQTNKCNQLIKQSNNKLYCVHSCDSIKLLNALNKACINAQQQHRLSVLIQVNTSNEESKSGCTPANVVDIYQHCIDHCSALRAIGLMTIGSLNDTDQSKCFQSLLQCKDAIMKQLGDRIDADQFELSMGMSADYETAIQYGATMIRIGSTIFGSRDNTRKHVQNADETTQQISGV